MNVFVIIIVIGFVLVFFAIVINCLCEIGVYFFEVIAVSFIIRSFATICSKKLNTLVPRPVIIGIKNSIHLTTTFYLFTT